MESSSDARLPEDVLHLIARKLDFQSLKTYSLCNKALRRAAVCLPGSLMLMVLDVCCLFIQSACLFRTIRFDSSITPCFFQRTASGIPVNVVEALVLCVSEDWMGHESPSSATSFENVKSLHIVGSAQTSDRRATDFEIARTHFGDVLQRICKLSLTRSGILYRDVGEILKLPALQSLALEGCFSHGVPPGSAPSRFLATAGAAIGRQPASGITDLTVISPIYNDLDIFQEWGRLFHLLTPSLAPALRNVRRLTLKNKPPDCSVLLESDLLPDVETLVTDFSCLLVIGHTVGSDRRPTVFRGLQLVRHLRIDLELDHDLVDLDRILQPGLFGERLQTFRIVARGMDRDLATVAAMASLKRKFPIAEISICFEDR